MSTQQQETWIPEWSFGDRLRKVRRDRGLSQGEAAEALGVKGPQLASWETGGNNPRDIVTIAKRCQLAFGVPAEWMLGLEMRSNPVPGGPDGGTGGTQPTRPKVAKLRTVSHIQAA